MDRVTQKKINDINFMIQTENGWKNRYQLQKNKIESHPVNFAHQMIIGTVFELSALAYTSSHGSRLDTALLASLGAFAIGTCVPIVIKKIRIADKDYQIHIINSILDDLDKKADKIKTLHK